MKKKIIDILIIFILIVILLINNVKALSSKIILEYEESDGYINILIRLEELDSIINAMSAKIEYDEQILKMEEITTFNDWSKTYSEETQKITLIKLSGTDQNEEVFKIKFKIEDEEGLNNNQIVLNDINISDGNEEIQIADIIVNSRDNETENNIVNNIVKNNTVKNNTVKNNTVKNNILKNNTVKNNTVKNNTVKNNTVKNNTIKNNTIKNNTVKNNIVTNKKTNSTVLVTNNNKNLRNDTTVKTDIPYAGITNYIRIGIIVLLLIGAIVYVKYKEINKIV